MNVPRAPQRGSSQSRQHGFSLVEFAVVLVIVGLLVGLVLKTREMQASAKVRHVADMGVGVQAAYLAFLDRYRHVPGDWSSASASFALGVPVSGGGNNNGRLDNPPGPAVYNEVNALWEHLSKAGFLRGEYAGTPATEPSLRNGLAPLNVFNQIVIVGRTDDYEGARRERLHVVLGRGIPVSIARELDVKLDDGAPSTGAIRATVGDAALTVFTGANRWGGRDAACIDPTPSWNVALDSQDCNAIVLF